MPPLPRFVSPAMEELAKDLVRSPQAHLLTMIDRIEALPPDIDPDRVYPADWVIYRISEERRDAAAAIPGAALLSDLAALCERLCVAAGMTLASVVDAGALDADTVAAKWRVSRKTLDRYRRLGLVSRRVMGESHKPQSVYMPATLAWFESAHASRLADAARFTRMDDVVRRRMVRRARRYRQRLRCSLNQASARIARRFGRSHEAVRTLLRKHDMTSPNPIFGPVLAPAARRRRMARRAVARGIEPGRIARRFGRSRASVVRLVLQERAALLRGLEFRPVAALEGDRAARVLAMDVVRTRLGAPAEVNLHEIIALGAARGAAPPAEEESARARGYHVLLSRCAARIADIDDKPVHASDIDQIETDLRWAARLKTELVRSQIPLVVRTLGSQVGEDLVRLRSAHLREMLLTAIAAVGAVVDGFDASRGGRLASPVGLAVNRAASRWVRENREARTLTRRASPRVVSGATLPDWSRSLCRWQSWLEPPANVRPNLDAVPPAARDVLMRRFGWAGEKPATLAEVAAALDITIMRAALRERAAIRAALAASRRGKSSPA